MRGSQCAVTAIIKFTIVLHTLATKFQILPVLSATVQTPSLVDSTTLPWQLSDTTVKEWKTTHSSDYSATLLPFLLRKCSSRSNHKNRSVQILYSLFDTLTNLQTIVGWLFWTNKHANKWLITSNCHFNATLRPSRASSKIIILLSTPACLNNFHANLQTRLIDWLVDSATYVYAHQDLFVTYFMPIRVVLVQHMLQGCHLSADESSSGLGE